MTHYGTKELAAAFRTVRANTIQTAQDIPEDKYGFRAAPDCRTVAQTLAHIAVSTGFQHHIQSNKVTDLKTVNFMELMKTFGILDLTRTGKVALPRTNAENGKITRQTRAGAAA